MDVILSNTVGLLVAAIIVALIARRLRLPYTVGLVVTGIALALIRIDRGAVLTHDFIFDVILPPLLFDLKQDPDEMTDLAGDPAHAGVMLACTQDLLSWRMGSEDRTLSHLRLTDEGVVSA